MKKVLFIIFIVTNINSDTLKVAVYDFPPCVILKKEGEKPEGFDIDVFENIIKKTEHEIKYVYAKSFSDLLSGIENDFYDVAISGITITGERETKMDFTHPYLNSGLIICINKDTKTSYLSIISRYTKNMMPMLLLIFIFSLICGVSIFLIEKKYSKKESMFLPEKPIIGIFNGFYFSNVFSSTVGFGDLVPKSIPGKMLSIIMIIIGVYFIFPYAIANMNSALQEEQKVYEINNVDDLSGKIVGTEKNTTSEKFLEKIGCNVKTSESINDAYELLSNKKINAVVFDMPTIKYFIKNNGKKKFSTSGSIFDKQTYGFALKKNSVYRNALNENLVDFMRTDDYWELYRKWLGEESN
jgi:ABC-type amino acid transport substrate-binding protein